MLKSEEVYIWHCLGVVENCPLSAAGRMEVNMDKILSRAWLDISLDALRHNYDKIREYVGDTPGIMGIVKGDAYGSGMVMVSRELEEYGASFLCVATYEEAELLRQQGLKLPVLMLGAALPEQVAGFAELDTALTVTHFEMAKSVSQAAKKSGKNIRIHVKLDTGMTRLGITATKDFSKAEEEVVKIAALDNIIVEGIYTHLAASYDLGKDDFTKGQYQAFTHIIGLLSRKGLSIPIRHCANSGAVVNYPHMSMDMVRPGGIMYGLWSAPGEAARQFLRLVEIRTRVVQVRDIDAGTPVSYDCTYVAEKPARIAVVSIGYGDGYSRSHTNRGKMLVHGRFAPLLGRVCMDLCIIDVTKIPGVGPGDVVTVCGKDGGCEITAEDLIADNPGLLPAEIFMDMNKRLPRRYLKNGAEISKSAVSYKAL